MTALELTPLALLVLGASALLVGIAKTSVGGMGALAVAGFALFLPARESTAAVLLLLILGDVVAVASYRRQADWTLLRRLLPSVLPGIALGALLVALVDDRAMTLAIAVVILAALALQVVLRRRAGSSGATTTASAGATTTAGAGATTAAASPSVAGSVAAGVAAGFATMVANAAGPVTSLYLLAARVDKVRFVGTTAWFYLLVNLAKVPFSVGLGLVPATTLWLTLVLAPVLLVGTWLGRRLLKRLSQRWFEWLTLGATGLAGLLLLTRALLAG